MQLPCAGPPLPLTGWPCRICVPTTTSRRPGSLTRKAEQLKGELFCGVQKWATSYRFQTKLPQDSHVMFEDLCTCWPRHG